MSTRSVVSTHAKTQKKPSLGNFALRRRTKSKHITQFTRQFSTLLEAGLPVVRSLGILQRNFSGEFSAALSSVKEDVESGSNLSESLARQSHIFDKLFINMIRAGEAGGVLDLVLARLADYRLAIFVSPNAVRAALARRTGDWPATTAIGVMGPGSAHALETAEHPAKLKDMVTTPAGCTIDGILELEEGGLRVTLIKAVVKATQRAKELLET